MNPIFNEYIEFLNDTNKTKIEDLKEGYFWLDKSIIKGFDKNGEIHKFYRVKIEDDLSVSVTKPKSGYDNIKDVDIVSWKDLIETNKNHLKNLEDEALKFIEEKVNKYKEYTSIIPVSTGKDSMVVAYLIRSLFPDTKAIFNNTSLDVVESYKMAKNLPNCEMMSPNKGFYQYVREDGMIPTRFARFCCRIFKVGTMVKELDHNHPYLLWMGMRNEESNTRKDYGDEVVNPEWGKTCWKGILPIRKWSELDVWLYTFWRGLEINQKYKYGYSRVGCAIACPYYTKSTWVLDKYFYRKGYDRWRDMLEKDFIENKKWLIMNCTLKEYLEVAWNGGTYRNEPTEEVIREFMKYNGLKDFDLAKQYFNKNCCECDKRIKDKNVLAMNMKIHGRQINKFYCKKCFMSLHNLSEDDWDNKLKSFKQNGCNLF
ncbi:MAG: phosphoadenosine phosphosulfate reductase family protein [Paludibacteraceae bacterium]|nr:phosphoadenosine phosphosulfate reductase family protein [Paludibacteraceae bacterium]